jgi:hypothetical protein
MNYQIYKLTNNSEEYHRAISNGVFAKICPDKIWFRILFDEAFDLIEAKHICRMEAYTHKTRCYIKHNSKQIFLTDYLENFKKELE